MPPPQLAQRFYLHARAAWRRGLGYEAIRKLHDARRIAPRRQLEVMGDRRRVSLWRRVRRVFLQDLRFVVNQEWQWPQNAARLDGPKGVVTQRRIRRGVYVHPRVLTA